VRDAALYFAVEFARLIRGPSLGLVPVMIGNPAERAIVRHAERAS
jgi:hypothetical protein